MTAKELFVIANNCEADDGQDWIVDSTDWKDQGLEIKQFYRKVVKPLNQNNYDLFIQSMIEAHWDKYWKTEGKAELIKWGNAIYNHIHKEQFNTKMRDFLNEES